jgi:hypothetical protein
LIELREKSEELSRMQADVKIVEDRIQRISSELIPGLFDEIGLSQVSLADGARVSIKTDYSASITEAKKEACFAWLKSQNLDSVIKSKLEVEFKKGENERSEALREVLDGMSLKYKEKKGVHPQTLKALVKEQIQESVDFPQELFSVYKYRETIVTR